MKAFIVSAVCLLSVCFIACQQPSAEKERDIPTAGKINIAADNEFKFLTQAEINVYQALYLKTTIHPIYADEDSIFKLLLNDSARLVVAGRRLTPSEEDYFHNKQLHPEQVKIGSDAIVFVVNNTNPDTLLTLDKIKAIFNSKDSLWKQLDERSDLGKINVVFDHENSGNAHYIEQKLMQSHNFPSYCFAVNGNPEVIDYVTKSPGAIGIIGSNWISNEYDSTTINFLKKVKVVAISNGESSNYFKPDIDNMQSGDYPLCRDIYIVSREAYTGLGSGFLSFVTCDKGQRIIYREGLLPLYIPSHTIHF